MESIESGLSRFRIADWEIDPTTNRVRRGEDEIRLEPKAMAVLVYLASRPERAVTRPELENCRTISRGKSSPHWSVG